MISHAKDQDFAIKQQNVRIGINNNLLLYLGRVLRLSNLLDSVEVTLNSYERALAQTDDARTTCESRLVTDRLIPLAMTKRILATGNNRSPIDPVQYYAYIEVDKITTIDQTQYCVLKAPIFTDNTQTLVYIATFPMCERGRCLQLYAPPPFILDHQTEDLYFPDDCHGPVPRACRPGVIYDKDHEACLHGLVNADTTQQQQCPLTYHSQLPPPGEIVTTILNQYILTTAETTYHYRCPRTYPKMNRLSAGTYIVTVEPHCVMDGGLWMLNGLPTMTFNYNVTNPLPATIPLTWLQLPDLNITTDLESHLPPGVTRLDVPNYETLLTPDPSDISARINNIQASIGGISIPWWGYLIVAACLVLLIIAIYGYCRIRFCPYKAPPLPVKYEATTDQVTMPPTSHARLYPGLPTSPDPYPHSAPHHPDQDSAAGKTSTPTTSADQ